MTLAKEADREKDAPRSREAIYLLLDLVSIYCIVCCSVITCTLTTCVFITTIWYFSVLHVFVVSVC